MILLIFGLGWNPYSFFPKLSPWTLDATQTPPLVPTPHDCFLSRDYIKMNIENPLGLWISFWINKIVLIPKKDTFIPLRSTDGIIVKPSPVPNPYLQKIPNGLCSIKQYMILTFLFV